MNKIIQSAILRYLIFAVLQIVLLKQIHFGDSILSRSIIFIYPLSLFMLPVRIPQVLLVTIGFIIGMSMDFFYDSPGVHSATNVFTAFIQLFVLRILEPRAGYDFNVIPCKFHFGFAWMVRYIAIMLFIHCLIFYIITVFTFYFWAEILVRGGISFVLSMSMALIYIILFNPKE